MKTKNFTLLLAIVADITFVWADALPGMFSVSSDKQVRFSSGNLQFNAALGSHQSADGTTKPGTWRFAEHQWDYVGNDQDGTVYENGIKCNNSLISPTYDGWIDLFGWGTGNNPTNASKKNNNYITFIDWGTNQISNGGNIPNLWRTLSRDEWMYLTHYRRNAENLFGMGVINGINGFILLPDNWNPSEDVPPFVIGIETGLIWRPSTSDYYNADGNNYSYNIYTDSQWQIMEENGAVFLPAAGAREAIKIWNVNNRGSYWTSVIYDSNRAYDFDFYPICLNPQEYNDNELHYGQSVRLVKDIEDNIYAITWQDEEGNVIKTDEVEQGTMPAYTGTTPTKEGYEFAGWLPKIQPATKDICYTTFFERNKIETPVYTVNINGENCSLNINNQYPEGTVITLEAVADECFEFQQWSDGNKDNPRTITVTANTNLTAEFNKVRYTVTGEPSTGGKVQISKQ